MKATKVGAAIMAVVSLLLVPALAGCGEGSPVGSSDNGGSGEPQARLTIRVRPNADAPAKEWTLTCGPAGGTHPKPEAACAALRAVDEPFEPVPPDAICTQIYGGPQQATIEGQWHGRHVRASYNRENGCEIHRWEAIKVVLQPHDASSSAAPEDQ